MNQRVHEFPNTGEPIAREFVCTKATPYTGQRAVVIRHEDAEEIGDQRDGYALRRR